MTTDLLGFGNTDNAVTTRPARSITRGATDTWARDCSTPDANDGTSWPADIFNDVLAQARVALRSSGIVLDNADDMLWRAMQSIGLRYGIDSGAAGALTVAYTPPVAALYEGLAVLVKVGHDCPGAVTFTPNGLATKAVTWPDASALASGDFKAACVLLLVYDGTQWQMIFKLNAGGAGVSNFVPGVIYHWPTETVPTGALECNGAAISRTTYARLFNVIGTTFGVGNGTTTFNIPELRGEFPRFWDHGRGADADAGARTNRGDGTTADHVGTKQVSSIGSLSATQITIDWPVLFGGPNKTGGALFFGTNAEMALGAGGASDRPYGGAIAADSQPNIWRYDDGHAAQVPSGFPWTPDDLSAGMRFYAGSNNPTDDTQDYAMQSLAGPGSITSGGNETRPRNVNLMPIIAY